MAKAPAPQSVPARPATLESPPLARPAVGGGFLVQVGVFSNLGNAEELRKKLADAGIPAQIEARVQVGPFATQAEASAAQHKLKSIGMEPGMVLPARRRPTMSGRLKLTMNRESDGTAEVIAEVRSHGFCGLGSAWFDLNR